MPGDIYEKFKKLPSSFRQELNSQEFLDFLDTLEERMPQIKGLATEIVIRLAVGDLNKDNLSLELKDKYHLQEQTIQVLTQELRRKFFPILEKYQSLLSEVEQKQQEQAKIKEEVKEKVLEKPEEFEQEEKEIEKIKESMPVSEDNKQDKIREVVENIIQKHNLSFKESRLKKRFSNIALTFLRGIRDEFQTKEVLTRSQKIGGMELSADLADKIIEDLKSSDVHFAKEEIKIKNIPEEKKVIEIYPLPYILERRLKQKPEKKQKAELVEQEKEMIEEPKQEKALEKPEQIKAKKPEGIKEKEVEKEEERPLPQEKVEAPVSLVETQKETTEVVSPVKKAEILPSSLKKDISVSPEEKLRQVMEQQEVKVEKPEKKQQEVQPKEQRIAEKTKPLELEKKEVVKPGAEEKPKEELKQEQPVEEQPVAAVPRLKTKEVERPGQEVKLKTKVYGPVDEIRSLKLVDWRRGGKPMEMAEHILRKINLLKEESLVKGAQAKKAWKESELYNLYTQIGMEAMEKGVDIEAVINQRKQENKPYLTKEDFDAISWLNYRLRF